MKAFDRQAPQGDIYLIRVDALPTGLKKAEPIDGQYIVAHSENGGHHVVDADVTTMWESSDAFIAYITTGDTIEDIALEHLRSFDTHEALALRPNSVYEVRRQREYTPQGYRRVMD